MTKAFPDTAGVTNATNPGTAAAEPRAPAKRLSKCFVSAVLPALLSLGLAWQPPTAADLHWYGDVEHVEERVIHDVAWEFGKLVLGEPYKVISYAFDGDGRLTSKESVLPNENPLRLRRQYEYGPNGVERSVYSSNSEVVDIADYEYDTGVLQRRVKREPDGDVLSIEEYELRPDGSSFLASYEVDGTLRFAERKSFDASGHMVAHEIYGTEGELRSGEYFVYDEWGRVQRSWIDFGDQGMFELTANSYSSARPLDELGPSDWREARTYAVVRTHDPATYEPHASQKVWAFERSEFIAEAGPDGRLMVVELTVVDDLRTVEYRFDENGNVVERHEGMMQERLGEMRFVADRVSTFDIEYGVVGSGRPETLH